MLPAKPNVTITEIVNMRRRIIGFGLRIVSPPASLPYGMFGSNPPWKFYFSHGETGCTVSVVALSAGSMASLKATLEARQVPFESDKELTRITVAESVLRDVITVIGERLSR